MDWTSLLLGLGIGYVVRAVGELRAGRPEPEAESMPRRAERLAQLDPLRRQSDETHRQVMAAVDARLRRIKAGLEGGDD